MTDSDATAAASRGPEGIGGWLILPVLGLVVTPIRGLYFIPATYGGIGPSLHLLTGGQRTFIVAEIAFNVAVLVVLPIFLLVLLFRKKHAFVRWFAIWAVVGLVGTIIDLAAAKVLFPDTFPTVGSLFDEATVREFARSIILVVLWVPYMLISQRVENTFVN